MNLNGWDMTTCNQEEMTVKYQCSGRLRYLVFLVLAGVGEAGDDGSDTAGGGDLTGVDHDEQLHEAVVDLPTTTLYNVNILASHRLSYLNTATVKPIQETIKLLL